MSSMLPMFAICSSSRIFSRRAFSSGVRFFLAICKTSNVVLLFYTTSEVYTKFGMVSIRSYLLLDIVSLISISKIFMLSYMELIFYKLLMTRFLR